jgi:hypothetical protein
MRIRVSLDITKLLCKGRKTRLEKGCKTWISFKYECLLNFCYWCGHVTHSDKDCPYWLRTKDSLRMEEQQFGRWLRASNEHPWRKLEIKVEGIVRQSSTKHKTPPSQPNSQTRTPTIKDHHYPPPPLNDHTTLTQYPHKTTQHRHHKPLPIHHHKPPFHRKSGQRPTNHQHCLTFRPIWKLRKIRDLFHFLRPL